jgi:phosphogluconate dehydratase
LLDAGLMHGDALTVSGQVFSQYAQRIRIQGDKPVFESAFNKQKNILSSVAEPFDESGGLVQVEGNLGKAVIKVSAVPKPYWRIQAPAKVFSSQLDVAAAYKNGELTGDFVLVLKGQGPKSNGMPELHKLMPILGNLQDAGQKVALLTDGRLSGASGKVLSAIHLVPEAANGGFISQLVDGDIVEVDVETKTLAVHGVDFSTREKIYSPVKQTGVGRELFSLFRNNVTPADKGAVSINWDE